VSVDCNNAKFTVITIVRYVTCKTMSSQVTFIYRAVEKTICHRPAQLSSVLM